ncbi:uncharacterized protein LOC143293601 [Babylonia areolata]|uniref:uncharacterized protein LOC143293601 n=1 Tax=Babylonia areolata TaxID=304850 RepID=UPI003FD4A6D1
MNGALNHNDSGDLGGQGSRKGRRSSEVIYNGGRPSLFSNRRRHSCDSSRTSSAQSEVGSESATDREETATETWDQRRNRQRVHSASFWQSLKRAQVEFNQDTRRMVDFIGRKLNSRYGQRETKVKEIRILPGEEKEDRMWARRMARDDGASSVSGPST